MNPQAGDTVTSTKPNATSNINPITTTTMITTKTTTGARSVARSSAASNRATTNTRKRGRQQELPRSTSVSVTRMLARPEVTPPPEKSRRRADPSKSRLGDFFSSLASRIRGPKSNDMPGSHTGIDNGQNDKTEVVMPVSIKREGNDELAGDANGDFNKRRKIEYSQSSDIASGDNALKELPVDKDVRLMTTDRSDSASVDKCDSELVLNPNLQEKDDELSQNNTNVPIDKYVSEEASVCESNNSNETIIKGEDEEQIIRICQSIVAIICEKIQEAEDSIKADPSTNVTATASSETIDVKDSCIEIAEPQRPKVKTVIEEDKDPTESPSTRYVRGMPKRDEAARLRKTIQWMEEGARRLREELAEVRSQLHEERRAAKLARREFDAAVREARNAEATRHGQVIAELKARLSQSPSRATTDSTSSTTKTELLKDENHRREVAALKKRLAEAEATIQKLKTNSLEHSRGAKKKNTAEEGSSIKVATAETRKLEVEVQSLRAVNKKLEEKLHIAEESARARAAEVRIQHESHEAELSALQKALRSDTIKMMDEIQSKNREIEKLERLARECAQTNEKLRAQEGETMRKLRESERSHQIRLAPRIEEKIRHDEHVVDSCKADCEEDDAEATELERLRELVDEQQEVIEMLRQTIKEKERKLEQLSNKRRKEEFYKQWLELEPVAEVDDEDEQQQEEGGDSALSSAPSSLSPQPGTINNNGNSGISRESYENLLYEIEDLQIKLIEEHQKFNSAKNQISDLERALLQETQGGATRTRELSDKLRDAQEREAQLVAELSELREQNELLEFRVLELEELPNPRDTPDPADSGIVSPEPIHLYKDHQSNSKHRDRAVATVIPYTSNYNHSMLSADPQKAPLSLQESGIFEDELVDGGEDEKHRQNQNRVELTSQNTQTEAPTGELLQEVQRLQELRVRIQERGVPPVSPSTDRKHEAPCDNAFDVAPLRERIRELEERLNSLEAERRLSKQREEELLDENERLTETTYCLESKLRKVQEKMDKVRLTSNAETMTEENFVRQMVRKFESDQCLDEVDTLQDGDQCMTRSQRLYRNAIQHMDRDAMPLSSSDECTSGYGSEAASSIKDQPCLDCSDLWKECDARIRNLARTEFCLRQQISSLEHRESAFFEILREADSTWMKLEAEYERKQREINERLSAQLELNRALFEHLNQLNNAQLVDASDEEEAAVRDNANNDGPVDNNAYEGPVDFDSSASKQAVGVQTDELARTACTCQRTMPRSSSAAATTGVIVRADSNRVSTISRTNIQIPSTDRNNVDTHGLPLSSAVVVSVEPPTEVATEAKEEDVTLAHGSRIVQREQSQQPEAEALVSIDKSSDDKKQVIYFRWR